MVNEKYCFKARFDFKRANVKTQKSKKKSRTLLCPFFPVFSCPLFSFWAVQGCHMYYIQYVCSCICLTRRLATLDYGLELREMDILSQKQHSAQLIREDIGLCVYYTIMLYMCIIARPLKNRISMLNGHLNKLFT